MGGRSPQSLDSESSGKSWSKSDNAESFPSTALVSMLTYWLNKSLNEWSYGWANILFSVCGDNIEVRGEKCSQRLDVSKTGCDWTTNEMLFRALGGFRIRGIDPDIREVQMMQRECVWFELFGCLTVCQSKKTLQMMQRKQSKQTDASPI